MIITINGGSVSSVIIRAIFRPFQKIKKCKHLNIIAYIFFLDVNYCKYGQIRQNLLIIWFSALLMFM